MLNIYTVMQYMKIVNIMILVALPLAFSIGRIVKRSINERINERRFSRGPPLIVLGASSGIGRAFAKYFALKGFNVIAAARRIDYLNALKSEVASISGNA